MQFLTYAHNKPDGSIFYIGKGTERRAHSSAGRNIVWKRTVKKHNGFGVEILSRWSTEKEAFDHEIFLIDTFRQMGYQLVNIAKGGMGSAGFRHSDEHKASKKKMMLERNPMASPELRQKQLIALRLAMQRPAIRAKQSAAKIGKKLTCAHVESLKLCHPMRACVVNGVKYKSLMEASRALEVRHGTLHRWLNNQNVKHNGKYRHIIEARWL